MRVWERGVGRCYIWDGVRYRKFNNVQHPIMDPRAGLTHQLSPTPSAILWILWVSYPRANLVIENGRLWYKQVVTFYFQLPYLTKGTVLFFLTSIPYNIPDVIIAQRAELPNIVHFSDFFFFLFPKRKPWRLGHSPLTFRIRPSPSRSAYHDFRPASGPSNFKRRETRLRNQY